MPGASTEAWSQIPPNMIIFRPRGMLAIPSGNLRMSMFSVLQNYGRIFLLPLYKVIVKKNHKN